MIEIKLTNKEKFKLGLNLLRNRTRLALMQGFYTAAQRIVAESKQQMASGIKNGIVYRKYNPNRIHRASAKGEAPAVDTGRLLNSHIIQSDHSKLIVRITQNTNYSAMLENKLNRPSLTPALEKNVPFLVQTVRALI